jgi:O-antigen/teichoic acid export membrane protein
VQPLLKGFVFRLIFTVAGFLVSLLIAKLAGAGRFGVLSLMIVNAAVIQIITGLGTDAAIVWHGVSGKIADRNKIFSITIYAALIQLIFFVSVAHLFFIYSGKSILSGQPGRNFITAELLYFTGLILTEKYSSLFYSQQRVALCNKLLAVCTAALLLLLLILWGSAPGIIAENASLVLSLFVFIPAVILIVYYQVKFKSVFTGIGRDDAKSFINFSFIVLVTNIIQFAAFRADFWLINYFHGKADTGIYAQAAKFSQMLWIIPAVLAGLIPPALRNEKNKLTSSELVAVCRVVWVSHIFLAILLATAAFLLYKFFLPAEYFNGFLSLLLMIPGYVLFTATVVLAAFFSAKRLLKINLQGSCLCFLLIMIPDLLLIPELSYKGAAIGNLISYSLTTAYFIAVSLKHTGMKAKDYFSIRKSDWSNIVKFIFKD